MEPFYPNASILILLRHFRQAVFYLRQALPAADRFIPDKSAFIDEKGRGNVLDGVLVLDIAPGIEQRRKCVVLIRHEFGDARCATTQIDRDDGDIPISIFIVKLLDQRHFGDTDASGRFPEVEKDRFAPQAG